MLTDRDMEKAREAFNKEAGGKFHFISMSLVRNSVGDLTVDFVFLEHATQKVKYVTSKVLEQAAAKAGEMASVL